jgi:hypothetical protein
MKTANLPTIHIPNGEMCIGCVHALRKCNHLNFPQMPVIDKKDPHYPIVKCVEYTRKPQSNT